MAVGQLVGIAAPDLVREERSLGGSLRALSGHGTADYGGAARALQWLRRPPGTPGFAAVAAMPGPGQAGTRRRVPFDCRTRNLLAATWIYLLPPSAPGRILPGCTHFRPSPVPTSARAAPSALHRARIP